MALLQSQQLSNFKIGQNRAGDFVGKKISSFE